MSSSVDSKMDLKAGHPPAVKAGGMRIVQHKRPTDSKVSDTQLTAEELEQYGVSPKSDKKNQTLIVSGAVIKGDRDFPEVTKTFHDKPLPIHEKRPMQTQHPIQQPRK
ncbi:Hypothetical predicted protein [Octopus vulgaris]|uniref:Uncharacterized protein n=2 Tax=Octopus TaxID=6643 RepID=A0AA36APB2_OCTVU|nr:death-associated protein 1 [Octopus sinensis]CAI9719776.1 Hypothetical predicted protein [Octopus vulgaris]